jgi:hypothetical protein
MNIKLNEISSIEITPSDSLTDHTSSGLEKAIPFSVADQMDMLFFSRIKTEMNRNKSKS